MFRISDFINRTAHAAKDAVRLYFQPLLALTDMVFASHSQKSKATDPF
jgi:hypothetical protein